MNIQQIDENELAYGKYQTRTLLGKWISWFCWNVLTDSDVSSCWFIPFNLKKNCCGRRGVSAADVPFHSHPSLCNTLLSFIIKYRRTLILIIENVFQELCWANWMPLYNRLMAALLRFFIKVLIKLTIQYQLSTRKSNILKNELCWMKWKCSLMHFIALPLESTTSYGIDQIFKKS